MVLIHLGFSDTISGGLGSFVGILGFVPLVTGLVGWFPIYAVLEFRTKNEAV